MSRIEKLAWADKFQSPTLAQLRAHYSKEKAGLFDQTRQALQKIDGLREEIAWQGVPWRWTLVYSLDGGGEDGRKSGAKAWAYLVPDPERLQVCVTLNADQIQHLHAKKLKKWVRDGIVFARSVAGVCWPTFEIASPQHLEDVLELIERKQKVSMQVLSQAR